MTRYDPTDKASPKPMPDWLTRESASIVSEKLRREWLSPSRADQSIDGHARLAAAMLMLQNERPRTPLFAQANAKALRWVDARSRASRAAKALSAAQPDLPLFVRAMGLVSRVTTPVACAFVLLLCKTQVLSMLEATGRLASRLGQAYNDRNFGPMA